MSSSQQLIIIRTQAGKKKFAADAGMVLNYKDALQYSFDNTVKFHLRSETMLAQTSISCFLRGDDAYRLTQLTDLHWIKETLTRTRCKSAKVQFSNNYTLFKNVHIVCRTRKIICVDTNVTSLGVSES